MVWVDHVFIGSLGYAYLLHARQDVPVCVLTRGVWVSAACDRFPLGWCIDAVSPPSLGTSSAVSIPPSRLKLPLEVSSCSIVKAGAFIPAHSP